MALIVALLSIVLPAMAYAAALSTPPTEFFAAFPATSAWLFISVLCAFIAAVGIIANLVRNSINKSIRVAEQANEAQWMEIRNLSKSHGKLDKRLTILETHHEHNHGGRRAYDPDVRLTEEDNA
jgi:hypothetical protein